MNRIRQWLAAFGKGEGGAVEPAQVAVLLALIVVASIAGLQLLGNAANKQNNSTSNMLQNATSNPSGS